MSATPPRTGPSVRHFLTLLLIILSSSACLASLPVRVAVLGKEAPAPTAQITEALAKLDGVEVLSRDQVERQAGKPNATAEERKALGKLLGVHLLILVDPSGDAFAYVDATTGEELFRIREDTPEKLAQSAFVLVEELRDAEKAAGRKDPPASEK